MEKEHNPVTERVENIGVEQKSDNNNSRKKEETIENSGKTRDKKTVFFIAAIVCLSILSIVLGTLLLTENIGADGEGDESAIRAKFYGFADYVDGVDENLSKLIVTKDSGSQQRYLVEVSTKALLAAEAVASLPIKDESKFNTISFANKISDYAKYLNNQLIDGLFVTNDDLDNLKEIKKATAALKEDLALLTANLGDDYRFLSLRSADKSDVVLKTFDELETRSENYPSLIYDGPFSDALEEKSAKGLEGEDVTLAAAEKVFKKYFEDQNIKNVRQTGETSGVIETYNFEAEVSADVKVYACVSKVGGKVVSFNYFADCYDEKHDIEECVSIAEDFLAEKGYSGMKAVWATESGATAYINFAYETSGVIVYNDMIKLTVCKERGLVSNMDAREYYLNHRERDIPAAKIDESAAREKVSDYIEIKNVKKAYIPDGENKEILAYEFEGEFDGSVYFVYIDAITGRQAQMFKVVDTAEGRLLV